MSCNKPSLNLLIALAARCPPNQEHYLKEMTAQRRKYIQKLESLPEKPPPIDWEFYKRNVRTEFVNMVEAFEKAYQSFQIPYPKDTYTSILDEAKEVVQCDIDDFIDQSNERIAHYEREIEYIECLPKFNEITWEEYIILYPEQGPDFLNRPTFWPHTPEEQLGYVEVKSALKSKKDKDQEGSKGTGCKEGKRQ